MTYTYDQTIELLQRAVAEKGDSYVYEKELGLFPCRYFNNQGTPSCIVGHVFDYVGLLTVIDDSRNYSQVNGTIGGSGQRVMPEPIAEAFSDASFVALQAAQDAQDDGKTWGEALIAAKGIEL